MPSGIVHIIISVKPLAAVLQYINVQSFTCLVMFCSGCKDNNPLYQVARLAERESLNLENLTNISSVSFISLVCTQNLYKCLTNI